MRLLIQRVSQAQLHIAEKLYSEIAEGLVVLIGIEDEDSQEDIDWLVRKMLNLRIFKDTQALMNASVQDVKGGLLLVSQFTLHASTKKGNRPSFIKAAKPAKAEVLYQDFIKTCKNQSDVNIQTGVFGADMQVSLINDGPVTIMIDSKNRE